MYTVLKVGAGGGLWYITGITSYSLEIINGYFRGSLPMFVDTPIIFGDITVVYFLAISKDNNKVTFYFQ